MVGARGFEPPTPWSQTRCATRLRYAPTLLEVDLVLHKLTLNSKKLGDFFDHEPQRFAAMADAVLFLW